MEPLKLIFVDDDPDDRELIAEGLKALSADSFQVLTSGTELFSLLAKVRQVNELPGTIVLDLNMPSMTGMDILYQLKTIDRYQCIPVFILTTSTSSQLKEQCIQMGAAGYYIKPNTLMELNTVLNNIYETV